ncbi:MAG: glycosyltransferase family 2 protein [Campylobacterales bacterium]
MFKDFSLIVPVYNEEDNIIPLFEKVDDMAKKASLEYEIVFVDDGSSDRSREIVDELVDKYNGVRKIYFTQNNGQSAAIAAGIRAASKSAIVTIDADLQNDPYDIPSFLKELENFDVVCGYRKKRQDNLIRQISSRVANRVRNFFTQDNLRDIGCALRAYRADSGVKDIYFFNGIHRFIPAIMLFEGKSITEIPTNHHPRIHGESKYTLFNRLFKVIYDLFGVQWMKSRYINYKIKEEA